MSMNRKNVILRNKIADDMKRKQPWKTINKVRKKKSKLPSSINGKSNEADIALAWRNHYENLMAGAGHPPINEVERKYRQATETAPRVTVNDIKEAMKKLSLNSAPGLDNVTGDHLRYAHPTLIMHFAMLFSMIFIHTYAPDNLTDIKIKNLIKDQQKSLSDMSNYRPIALASLISKLLECVILQRCENNLKTSDNQFAYKVDHSTDMALFSFRQTVDI